MTAYLLILIGLSTIIAILLGFILINPFKPLPPNTLKLTDSPYAYTTPHLSAAAEDVEILQLHEDGQLYHHSWRRQGHPDIAIFAKNSRFNVRQQDGSLMREDS